VLRLDLGQRRSLDDVHYLQKYVPRRPRSVWSQVDVAKVEALTACGRMCPHGLAQVEAAKADGRWAAAYASQRAAEVPPTLPPRSPQTRMRRRRSSASTGPDATG